MALSQPKGGAHALARKRMMEAAMAKSRGATGQTISPSSVHSQDQGTTFRQFAVSTPYLKLFADGLSSATKRLTTHLRFYHGRICRMELAKSLHWVQACMML